MSNSASSPRMAALAQRKWPHLTRLSKTLLHSAALHFTSSLSLLKTSVSTSSRRLLLSTANSTRSSTRRRRLQSSQPRNSAVTKRARCSPPCRPILKMRASSSPLTMKSMTRFLADFRCTLSQSSWTCLFPADLAASVPRSPSSLSELAWRRVLDLPAL